MTEHTDSSRREKSSRVATLKKSGVVTRDILSPKEKKMTNGDTWEESRVDPGGDSVLQKRKIISGSCAGRV